MQEDRAVFAGGAAVITGAGAGLGAGLARRAAELGMRVALIDISQPALDAIAAEVRSLGAEAMPLLADVSKPAELDRAAERIHGQWGEVRLLINNAGIETIGNSWDIPAERWEQTLNINIHGVVHGVRAFAPHMLASGKPAFIANLSSIGGFSVMPMQTAYIMTKHAVQAFSECLFLEMQMTGKPIHVASVIPGMVKTSIFAAAPQSAGETAAAAAHRTAMREMMAAYGMDLAEASKLILEQIAARKFWVSTQPDMTHETVAGRIAFLAQQKNPEIPDAARHLLGGH